MKLVHLSQWQITDKAKKKKSAVNLWHNAVVLLSVWKSARGEWASRGENRTETSGEKIRLAGGLIILSLSLFLLFRVVRQQPLVNAAPRARLASTRPDSPQPPEELLDKDATLWNLSRHDRYEFMASSTLRKQDNNAADFDAEGEGWSEVRGRNRPPSIFPHRCHSTDVSHFDGQWAVWPEGVTNSSDTLTQNISFFFFLCGFFNHRKHDEICLPTDLRFPLENKWFPSKRKLCCLNQGSNMVEPYAFRNIRLLFVTPSP